MLSNCGTDTDIIEFLVIIQDEPETFSAVCRVYIKVIRAEEVRLE